MEPRTVKDLMLSLEEYATVSSDATLREALVALSKAQMGLTYDRHHHRAVLVLDREGRVIGKLTHWAILRSLEPRLFGAAEHEALSRSGLSPEFIQSLRQRWEAIPADLELMCRAASKVRARDAMVAVQDSIDEEAPLTEAIRMLVVGHWQSLLVTRDGEVVGILRLADVFEEVADQIRGPGSAG
jgi:CBS domain-containing protein